MTEILHMDESYYVMQPQDTAGGHSFDATEWERDYDGQVDYVIDANYQTCALCNMTSEKIFQQKLDAALDQGIELSHLRRWTFSGWRSFITDPTRDDWRPIDPLTSINIENGYGRVFLCWECYPDYVEQFSACDECGDYYHTDEMNMCEICGIENWMCNDCHHYRHGDCRDREYYDDPDEYGGHIDPDSRNRDPVHHYGHRPEPNMLGSTEQIEALRNIWFGVENETEQYSRNGVRNLGALALRDGEQKFYLKRDTSVSGVEIVSHPATLDYHRTAMHWDEILDAATDD